MLGSTAIWMKFYLAGTADIGTIVMDILANLEVTYLSQPHPF